MVRWGGSIKSHMKMLLILRVFAPLYVERLQGRSEFIRKSTKKYDQSPGSMDTVIDKQRTIDVNIYICV